jgi:arginine-tRNA-protein transferase
MYKRKADTLLSLIFRLMPVSFDSSNLSAKSSRALSQTLAQKFTQKHSQSSSWYSDSMQHEWRTFQLFKQFELDRATPAMMDSFWADGWRHFGTYFFREIFGVLGKRLTLHLALRINLEQFRLSKRLRRIRNRNNDAIIIIDNAHISAEKEYLFEEHSQKFTDNKPQKLTDFISQEPSIIPCSTKECRVEIVHETIASNDIDENELIAISFFDIGEEACSSVYAFYDIEESQKRSLGILTLMKEIEYAIDQGKKYMYLGYSFREHSHYDYKKQFAGLEFYTWQGEWLPIEELEHYSFPHHVVELFDITQGEFLGDV